MLVSQPHPRWAVGRGQFKISAIFPVGVPGPIASRTASAQAGLKA